jgi:hypothetical protein
MKRQEGVVGCRKVSVFVCVLVEKTALLIIYGAASRKCHPKGSLRSFPRSTGTDCPSPCTVLLHRYDKSYESSTSIQVRVLHPSIRP